MGSNLSSVVGGAGCNSPAACVMWCAKTGEAYEHLTRHSLPPSAMQLSVAARVANIPVHDLLRTPTEMFHIEDPLLRFQQKDGPEKYRGVQILQCGSTSILTHAVFCVSRC